MEGAETTDREWRDAEEEKWVSGVTSRRGWREEMMRRAAKDLGNSHTEIRVVEQVLDEIDRRAAELGGGRTDG